MAIIQPIFGEMRGSIGGTTWSRNKGGMYARRRSTPTNPNSSRQQSTRTMLAICAANWSDVLTEPMREEWREWAQVNSWKNSLGVDVFLTGLDWYGMVNSRLLDAGAAAITSPGDLSAPPGLATLAITLPTTTTIAIAFTPALPTGGRLVAWGSGPLSVGQDPNFRQSRLIGYSAANAATPVTLVLPYTVVVGQKLKVFVGVLNAKGRESTLLVDVETKA
jgi:hypothetical protein